MTDAVVIKINNPKELRQRYTAACTAGFGIINDETKFVFFTYSDKDNIASKIQKDAATTFGANTIKNMSFIQVTSLSLEQTLQKLGLKSRLYIGEDAELSALDKQQRENKQSADQDYFLMNTTSCEKCGTMSHQDISEISYSDFQKCVQQSETPSQDGYSIVIDKNTARCTTLVSSCRFC